MTSLQNATSTPGDSARFTSVELSEKAMTTPTTASAPNVFALRARIRVGGAAGVMRAKGSELGPEACAPSRRLIHAWQCGEPTTPTSERTPMEPSSEIEQLVTSWFGAASHGDASLVDRHVSASDRTRLVGNDDAGWTYE